MKKISLSFLVVLTLFVSCGKSGGGSSSGSTEANAAPALEEQKSEGYYRAILRPYNNSLSGFLPTGFAEIRIVGDSVQVKTLLDDDARVPHIQSVQMGTKCPSITDDLNGDSLVDIEESYKASGEVFIPLDNDLQVFEGTETYPVGGGYTYTKTATLTQLESDAKAKHNQNLNLGGRVVIIHGVTATTKVPASVATRNGLTPQTTAPIACGILQRMP